MLSLARSFPGWSFVAVEPSQSMDGGDDIYCLAATGR